MVGIALSPENIRTAPPEVRRWLEQELFASFGLQPPTAEPGSPQLVACNVEEAATVLSLIQGMIPAVNVFFELGREGTKIETQDLVAFRLSDILRHTRLQTLEQVVTCLDIIGAAVQRVHGNADAALYGLDDRGHCFIAAQTQRSILHVWQQIIAARNLEGQAGSVGQSAAAPMVGLPGASTSAPSCPIWPAAARAPTAGVPDRSAPDVGLESVPS